MLKGLNNFTFNYKIKLLNLQYEYKTNSCWENNEIVF